MGNKKCRNLHLNIMNAGKIFYILDTFKYKVKSQLSSMDLDKESSKLLAKEMLELDLSTKEVFFIAVHAWSQVDGKQSSSEDILKNRERYLNLEENWVHPRDIYPKFIGYYFKEQLNLNSSQVLQKRRDLFKTLIFYKWDMSKYRDMKTLLSEEYFKNWDRHWTRTHLSLWNRLMKVFKA